MDANVNVCPKVHPVVEFVDQLVSHDQILRREQSEPRAVATAAFLLQIQTESRIQPQRVTVISKAAQMVVKEMIVHEKGVGVNRRLSP